MTQKRKLSDIKFIYSTFFGTGTIFALIAIILRYQNNPLLSDFFLQVSVSVFSVTIIEIIWRSVGGEPLERQIQELSQMIPLSHKWRKLGVIDIFESRRQINIDELINRIKIAKEVDMMGLSLRANWTSNERFMEVLSENVETMRCHFRILILDPSSPFATQRMKEEYDQHGRLKVLIEDSLYRLKKTFDELDEKEKKFLEIRTLSEYTMYCSIIRIDETMLVTFYMCTQRGSSCPTLLIEGRTPLFNKFMQEFERLWESGSPLK
jgi:hypothetical protein